MRKYIYKARTKNIVFRNLNEKNIIKLHYRTIIVFSPHLNPSNHI